MEGKRYNKARRKKTKETNRIVFQDSIGNRKEKEEQSQRRGETKKRRGWQEE
jgi:hypothetical protein